MKLAGWAAVLLCAGCGTIGRSPRLPDLGCIATGCERGQLCAVTLPETTPTCVWPVCDFIGDTMDRNGRWCDCTGKDGLVRPCPTPTPTPEPAATPTPTPLPTPAPTATPTPTPTPTATPTPPPGEDSPTGTCPCPSLHRWSVGCGLVDGDIRCDSTPRFGCERGPACACNADHHESCRCSPATWTPCEDPRGPVWTYSGPGHGVQTGEWGYQFVVRNAPRGVHEITACPRGDLQDGLGRPVRVEGAPCDTDRIVVQ